jgi:hypothetical protein
MIKGTNDTFFYEYSGMFIYDCTDINDDYRNDVITMVTTAYGGKPRKLVIFDYDSEDVLWQYPTAPTIIDITNTWDKLSGQQVVLVSSYSVANGAKLEDGTDDMHTYLWLLSGDGKCIWQKELGDYFVGSHAMFADVNRDGIKEILVSIYSAWNHREVEIGHVYLLDMLGNIIGAYTNYLSIWGTCIIPNYVEKDNNILISSRKGTLTLLNSQLKKTGDIRFSKDTEYFLRPFVKGIVNTRFGEYIVVYCWEQNDIYCDPSDGRLGGSKTIHHFYNVHVKICDKKTLKEKYRIHISDFESDDPIYRIHIYDVDFDGDDEILVTNKDEINQYKLTIKK